MSRKTPKPSATPEAGTGPSNAAASADESARDVIVAEHPGGHEPAPTDAAAPVPASTRAAEATPHQMDEPAAERDSEAAPETEPDAEPAPAAAGTARRRFADLSVRTRIIALALALALVTALVSAYALTALLSAAEGTQDVVDMTTGMVADANTAGQATSQSLASVRRLEKVDSDVARTQALDGIATSDAAIASAMAAFETSRGTRAVPAWETFVVAWQDYVAYRDENIIAHLSAGGSAIPPIIEVVAQGKADAAQEAFLAATAEINAHANEVGAAADARSSSSVVVLIGVASAGVLLALLAGFALAAAIRRPVEKVRGNLEDLAKGDLTFEVTVDQRDEVGMMAEALRTAQRQLRAVLTDVINTTQAVASSASELAVSGTQVSAGAVETSAQAGVVAAAAEEVSRNVHAVATGAEQMGASIREIAQNANEAAKVASRATEVAAETNMQIARLGTSSQEIGNVVKTITQIAEQTNLLALNATIEAARAGEAGKGFAVVAGEVKELAQETSRATEDISRRVDAIQSDTKLAVAAIAQITEIIGSINDYQLTIASAVEEQTATTNEISRGVTEVATGSGEIAQGITTVAEAARVSTEVLAGVASTVDDLALLAERLRAGVATFSV